MTDKERELEQLAIERGTRIDSLERELEEERELRQQYAEDAKRNLRDRDAAEARLAERERELAEARAQSLREAEYAIATEDALKRLKEIAYGLRKRAEAAEARLAAVDRVRNEMNECCRWEDDAPAVNVRQLKNWVAALTAPDEPHSPQPDDMPFAVLPESEADVCGKQCAHGSECLMLAGHEPADRHETQHGCVFYDDEPAEPRYAGPYDTYDTNAHGVPDAFNRTPDAACPPALKCCPDCPFGEEPEV